MFLTFLLQVYIEDFSLTFSILRPLIIGDSVALYVSSWSKFLKTPLLPRFVSKSNFFKHFECRFKSTVHHNIRRELNGQYVNKLSLIPSHEIKSITDKNINHNIYLEFLVGSYWKAKLSYDVRIQFIIPQNVYK